MKQITFLLSVLFLSALFCACSNESVTPPSDIQLAESFIGSNYDSVIYYAENSLKKADNKEDKYYVHFILGYAYLKKNEHVAATSNYLLANELIPTSDQYRANRASILKNLGYIAKTFYANEHAIDYYSESLKIVSEEEKAGVLYNLGNVYKKQEKYNQAIEQFKKSLELATQFNQTNRIVKANVQIGLVYAKQDRLDESESHLMSIIHEPDAVQYNKQLGRAYHILANNEMTKKNYEYALSLFDSALTHFSSNTDQFITYMDVGDCYLRMGDHQEALASLQNAKNLYADTRPNPQYAEVFNLLATAHELNDNTTMMAANLRAYGAALKDFLQQKEEIIQLLNKQRFEQLVSSRATLKDLWGLLFTYRNIGILAIAVVCLLLLVLVYKYYRSVQLKKHIARELNSI